MTCSGPAGGLMAGESGAHVPIPLYVLELSPVGSVESMGRTGVGEGREEIQRDRCSSYGYGIHLLGNNYLQ